MINTILLTACVIALKGLINSLKEIKKNHEQLKNSKR